MDHLLNFYLLTRHMALDFINYSLPNLEFKIGAVTSEGGMRIC